MNRSQFLTGSGLAAGSLLINPLNVFAYGNPIYSAEEITEFVFAAHKDLDETKKIIKKKPLLLNCTNQFKKGDFETALGGASHMGRKDIADHLVELGARMDIFNMTFLGHTELVKEYVKVSPAYLNSPGPHGFTLLHHAKVGGHDDLASWLEDQGLTETHFKGIF